MDLRNKTLSTFDMFLIDQKIGKNLMLMGYYALLTTIIHAIEAGVQGVSEEKPLIY